MRCGGRIVSFSIMLLAVLLLITFSISGALGPLESVVTVPLNLIQRVVGSPARSVGGLVDDLAAYQRQKQRIDDLEEALAVYQAELAQLREKGEDYDRLAALLDYNRFGPEDHEYVTCDVIGRGATGFVHSLQINCGRRDGVSLLDPVVTERGLVGRVAQVSATGAQVLLLSDPKSRVNARLQTTRDDGVVIGQLAGDLIMSFISIDAAVSEGDLVLTSGLGQTLPADLVVGQVLSASLAETELYQEARVRSLVDFDRLEIVQVLVNFEPVDLTIFQAQEGAGAP
ncbi:MAG: rod shape-determining protein MreC [Anaerolineae bacterium]|nr:rod shape-determining protein MreC [Anaerolineae bacterium]